MIATCPWIVDSFAAIIKGSTRGSLLQSLWGSPRRPGNKSCSLLLALSCVDMIAPRIFGNWLIAKVLRRMLGFPWGGIVWAGIEFCHEEVDLFMAEEFRDNAEAPFLERGGDCFEISHEYTFLINWNKPHLWWGTSIGLTVRSGPILVPEGQKVIAPPFMAGDRF